jgi:hypothetical protein
MLPRDREVEPYDAFIGGVPPLSFESFRTLERAPATKGLADMVSAIEEADAVGGPYPGEVRLQDAPTSADAEVGDAPLAETYAFDPLKVAWQEWQAENRGRVASDPRFASDMVDYQAAGVWPDEAEECRAVLAEMDARDLAAVPGRRR